MDSHDDWTGGPPFSDFSAGYVMCENVEVRRWNDELAGMDPDLYDVLAMFFGEPIIGYIDGIHYEFRPMAGIPSETAAVPQDNHGVSPDVLLLQK